MKSRMKKKKAGKMQGSGLLTYLMIFCPFLGGMVENHQIFLVTSLLLLILAGKTVFNRQLRIWCSVQFFAGAVIFLCSIGTVFYGISSGEAFFGVFRVLSMAVFGILVMQYGRKERREALLVLPDVGVLMMIVSAAAFLIPDFKHLVTNGAGRMMGFFPYANAFALFLLLGLVVYIRERLSEEFRWQKLFYPGILLGGILWSGSRIVFVLTVLSMGFLILKNKRLLRPLSGVLACAVIAAAGYVFFTGNTYTVGRFLTIFQRTSTLVGRILYFEDGIRFLLKHPMGMGYCGYYLLQPYEQTGVYVVKYVHNEWLQAALDYGVLAGFAFLVFLLSCIKASNGTERFVLVLIAIHSCFDFDLQFLVFAWILFLCTDWERGKLIELGKKESQRKVLRILCVISALILEAVYLWLGAAEFLKTRGQYAFAHELYPWAVVTEELALSEEYTDAQKIEKYADHILKEFPYAGIAYEAKAIVEKVRNDYLEMAKNQRMAVRCQKYSMEKYENYVFMLEEAILYYEEHGQTKEREICIGYLKEIPEFLKEVEGNTNPLTYQTVDAPNFTLSDRARAIIEKY